MQRLSRLLLAAVALASAPLHAANYDAFYVFGDSLSDRGNLAEAFNSPFPDPPSYHYSFTNGPVAVSLVAASYGLAADPSLWLNGFQDTNNLFPAGYQPGTNYAVGDATANSAAPGGLQGINLPDQIGAYLNHVSDKADGNALYTVFIGGNDVKDATRPNGGGAAAIETGVADEIAAITALQQAGAQHFLVVNVPDVGAIPLFAEEHPDEAAAATANTILYNTSLASALAGLRGLNLTTFNLYSYEKAILANASLFGLTNITDPCYTQAPLSTASSAACGPNAENIDHFAYWNDVHPTKQVHALIAQGIEQALAGDVNPSPVPEPASWAMMIAGFALLGSLHRQAACRVPPMRPGAQSGNRNTPCQVLPSKPTG